MLHKLSRKRNIKAMRCVEFEKSNWQNWNQYCFNITLKQHLTYQ